MIKTKTKNRHNQTIIVQIEKPKVSAGLVFIAHGLGGFIEQKHIEVFADAFKQNNFTVVRWDATNSIGKSGGSIENATLTGFYKDFQDVIAWAKSQEWYQKPFVLSGHSLGSACNILYAAKHQNQVKAIAPISAFLSGKTYANSLGKDSLREWKKKGFILQESTSKPGITKKLNWLLMEDLLQYQLFDQAPHLSMPVLLIVGSKDQGTPLSDQQKFLQAIPHDKKELHVIKGAPHTFYDQAHLNEIKEILINWIKKILS